MTLLERDGLRILVPAYGYILRHIKSGDIYSGRIYLSADTSMDEYEEVIDITTDERLAIKLEEVTMKEKSLDKIGKLVANQITDDTTALSIQEFYDQWDVGVLYLMGRYIRYDDILYKVLIEHTSQDDWTPDISPSLFAKVLTDPTGETVPEWVQPDSTNAYMIGDKVMYEGVIYISLIDNNVWSPAEYPAGWEAVDK